MSYIATESILYQLSMYYAIRCMHCKDWPFIQFNENIAKLFIDRQQFSSLEFDSAFLCAIQNPELYDETYLLDRHLKQFYLEMEWWISGKNCKYRFSDVTGLCGNLRKYMYSNDIKHEKRVSLLNMLKSQFISAGLDEDFPFNSGLRYKYDDEHFKYENQQRIDWIKKHATSV